MRYTMFCSLCSSAVEILKSVKFIVTKFPFFLDILNVSILIYANLLKDVTGGRKVTCISVTDSSHRGHPYQPPPPTLLPTVIFGFPWCLRNS